MSILDHELTFAIDAPSPNRGGLITPRFVVMHYTAGFTAESAVRTLTSPSSRVSAHVTIDENGSVYQHVPFNVKAWHAGPSRYAGYSNLNSHSIGIEIVNPGWFRRSADGNFYRDNIRRTARQMGEVIEAPHPRVGSGMLYWPTYTEAQLDAVEELTEELLAEYPSIIDIVSHEEIDTRGWKTDPGPAFPMNRYKRLLPTRDLDYDQFQVTASSLNVRSGPGTNFGVLREVKRGDIVDGQDQSGSWIRVDSDGWVHGGYLRRV